MRDFEKHLRVAQRAVDEAALWTSKIFVMEFGQNSNGVKCELEGIDLALRAVNNALARALSSFDDSVREQICEEMERRIL